MRILSIFLACVLAVAMLGCDREPEAPKGPPPNPQPVPSVPQASAPPGATQPAIVPSAATQREGPEAPAVGSVKQPPRQPGGDANPVVTTPGGTGPGAGAPATR